MFTLATLLGNGWLRTWELPGHALPWRYFYYSAEWEDGFNRLEGTPRRRRGLTMDLSPRGRVTGFIDRFVGGRPKATFVRPIGEAMEPPFQRMRPPNVAVVEMRTEQTRSFGFFAKHDVFVAIRLEETTRLKADRNLYLAHAQRVQGWLRRLKEGEFDDSTDPEHLVTDPIEPAG